MGPPIWNGTCVSLRLCAGRTGQLLDLSAVAGEAGISHSTAANWLSVLEASDVVFRLPPYHRNFGKRLVKSPKLYFVDSGLACWLLGIHRSDTLALHPLRGALFETLMMGEALKARCNRGLPADLYFWRDNHGNTRDLVQAATAFSRRIGEPGHTPWLVYGGDEHQERSDLEAIGWRGFGARLLGLAN